MRPTIAYGGTRGILGAWFREARDSGTVTFAGDGSQVWSVVHIDDVAEAYALALEHAASGERYLLSDGSAFRRAGAGGGRRARHRRRDALDAARGGAAEPRHLRRGPADHAAREQRQGAADLGWVPRHTNFVAEIEAIRREWQGPREAPVS